MANEEHVRILEQGADVWNRWRQARPNARINLSVLYFLTPNLNRAVLRKANLVGASFVTSRRHSWAFEESTLRLTLGGVPFKRFRIVDADLRSADLTGANLSNTYFVGANLEGADLSGATIGETVFDDVDLSQVLGLGSVKHLTRSTIGVMTLLRCGPQLPEIFLRGLGVPDDYIQYVRSLSNLQLQYHSCFISYSNNDHALAERLYADLQARGVRCWFAPEDMKIGDKIRTRIDESIRLHDKLLLVLSGNSLASTWVADEVESALEKERRQGTTMLFPITLDDAVWDSNEAWAVKIRRERHIGNFRRWKEHDSYQAAFERLLRDLKAEGG